MFDQFIKTIIEELAKTFSSVPFGAFSLSLGGLIYVPTGSRLGKFLIIIGLIVLTLNVYVL